MNIHIKKSFIVALSALTVIAVLAGCAHNKSKDDSDTATPQKQEKSEKADKKADKKTDKKDDNKSGLIGTPAPGSKFAKLKLGMTMDEVFAKIGNPDARWHHPTGKAHIPFYYGDDRWVWECSYKKEGRLTFTGGSSRQLMTIEVNKKEMIE